VEARKYISANNPDVTNSQKGDACNYKTQLPENNR
jgi:hypothetical protein